MEKVELTKLISGCVSNERKAQELLYRQFVSYVYNLTIRYLRSSEDAQDATQETFIQLFKSITSFDPNKGAFKSWLSKIAINKALKLLAKDKDFSISFDPKVHDINDSKSNSIESKHSVDELMRYFDAMPDSYRVVFDLFAVEGFSHNEISEMLDISSQNSRVLLNRGRQWLQTRLGDKKLKMLKSL